MNKSQVSPEQLLALLEALIRDIPQFGIKKALNDTQLKWIGRADAALEASGSMNALLNFRIAKKNLGSYSFSRDDILLPLHEAYSKIEILAPATSQGGFIPAGDTWNGYAALVQLVQTECDDLLIVDPYLNSSIYIEFAPHSSLNTSIRFLTTQKTEYHDGLVAAAKKWASDPISKDHPVEGRYAPSNSLHDRLIIIDGKVVWLVSQSFKDIAKKSPASVSRADPEMTTMKAVHYEGLWQASSTLV